MAARTLLWANAPLDCLDAWERLPLHYAAERGYLTLTKLLMKTMQARKQDPQMLHKSDLRGDTPLSLAVQQDRADVVRYLIKCGARPPALEARLATQKTATKDAERLLSDLGVDLGWYRMLCGAAERGHVNMCTLLTRHVLTLLPRAKRLLVAPLLPRPVAQTKAIIAVAPELNGFSASLINDGGGV